MYYKKLKQLIQNGANRMRNGATLSAQNQATSQQSSLDRNGTAFNVSSNSIQPHDATNQRQATNTAVSANGNAGSRAQSAGSNQSKTSFISNQTANSGFGSLEHNQMLAQQQQQQQRIGSAGQVAYQNQP